MTWSHQIAKIQSDIDIKIVEIDRKDRKNELDRKKVTTPKQLLFLFLFVFKI